MATGASPEERETLMCLIQSGASETATETAGAAMLVMLFVSLWTLIEGNTMATTDGVIVPSIGLSCESNLLVAEQRMREHHASLQLVRGNGDSRNGYIRSSFPRSIGRYCLPRRN